MKICRFDNDRLGLVEGREILDVTAATAVLGPLEWPTPFGDHAFRHLDELLVAVLSAAREAPRLALDEVKLLSPVANPSKVIAAPLNYTPHVAEVGQDAEIHANTHATEFEGFRTPIEKLGLFLKATTSVAGPGAGVPLVFPHRRSDHEVELAVVIGREARDLDEAEALDAVAGYCIGLDMTVRGPEDRSMRKSPDGYTVLGPWLVTSDELPEPEDVDLSLRVDGELRQAANTAELTVGVRQLVSLASRWYTLYPGDVILTGTPGGVGPVSAGQTMVARIQGVGEMSVTVR
jgi:2-keto-4-pentenoate hydratase/2-oxohepta-3-ene-1,7-dioic acid hydratase in catechol pathway